MDHGILLFGANRGTGLAIARLLRGRGEQVTAMVRPGSDAADLEAIGARIVRGNILDRADVEAAFAAGPYTAVIDTVGGRRGEPRPDFEGTVLLVDETRQAGVRRFLFVTAIGCGDSRPAVAPRVIEFLGPVLDEKTKGENYLIASGLDYTILRPGGMKNDPPSGTAIRTEDHSVMGVINRDDLARLVVECLDDPAAVGRIYHAIDPAITEQAPLQRGESLPGGRM